MYYFVNPCKASDNSIYFASRGVLDYYFIMGIKCGICKPIKYLVYKLK